MLNCREYWEDEVDNLENIDAKRALIEFEIENIIYTEELEKKGNFNYE